MKKGKILLSVFTLTTITSVFLPSICVAEISIEANCLKKAGSNQTIYMKTLDKKTLDKKTFISPNYNCDPKMLIQGNPDIDPRFLVKQLP